MSRLAGLAFGLATWAALAALPVGAHAQDIPRAVVAELNRELAELQKVDAVDPSDVTADKIGGTDVLCIPMAKRQALFDMAKDHGAEVYHYAPEETEAFLRITNALPPVTTLTGANMVTMSNGDSVVVAFDEGDRFCRIMQDVSKKAFDEVMKKAASL